LMAFGLTGLITSIPYIANGHENVRLNKEIKGALILSLYT